MHETSPDTLLLIDGISGLGAVPFETDALGPRRRRDRLAEELDVASGPGHDQRLRARLGGGRRSQDAALLLRPGQGAQVAGHRRDAVDAGRRRALRDGCRARDAREQRATSTSSPATPHARRRRRPACRRSGSSFSPIPRHASQTVTAAWLPEGVDWAALNKAMRARGLVLAGGQDRLAGQILRIGHLGDVSASRTWSPRSRSSARRSPSSGTTSTSAGAVEAAATAAARPGRTPAAAVSGA